MPHSIHSIHLLLLLAIVVLAIAACGTDTPPTPTAGPSAGAGDAQTGRSVFRASGCTTCHGEEGVGTDRAPALAGHTAAEVRAQVRDPEGRMSAYGPDRISEQELADLVAFVTSLETADGHDHHHEH